MRNLPWSGKHQRTERGDILARKQGKENNGVSEDDKGGQVWTGITSFLKEVVKEAPTDNA